MVDSTTTWVIHGATWTLPVWVAQVEGLMRVRGDKCYTRLMREALEARLSELGTSNGQDWFLTRATLERAGEQLGWVHPPMEDLISWVPAPKVTNKKPEGHEEFYQALTHAGFSDSPQGAQLRYGILCQVLLEHLIVRRRPVDLGFAILEALPLRIDWIRCLHHKRPLNSYEFRRGGPKWVFNLIKNGRVMAYSATSKLVLWTLSVRHKRAWWKNVVKVEKAERDSGRGWYLLNAVKRLKAKQEAIYDVLMEYLHQARRASLKIPARVNKRDKATGKINKPTIRPPPKRTFRGGFRRSTDNRPQEGESEPLGESSEILSPLPDIQQGEPNLRKSDSEPEDPATGIGG